LRAVIGDIVLDDVLAQREHINQVLRSKLDETTERWGVKVTAVEIREIVPPREIQDAMTRQMSAERTRRAVVTEAQGKREASITVAEGEKQSAILSAEGKKQAAILEAEGQRASQVLVAEGFAVALDKIYDSAKTVDEKTMALQYLEVLKAVGTSPST
jgi:regulator of protease activity HflC (stomatin/prohibitin superfamily)